MPPHRLTLRLPAGPGAARGREGVRRAGRVDGGPKIVLAAKPLSGQTAADVARARDAYRPDLAFLYSTPAYARQLEMLGLGDLAARLASHAKGENWEAMADCLDDDVMERLVPSGPHAELAAVLARWYDGRCDGLILDLPADPDDDPRMAEVIVAARDITTRRQVGAVVACEA
ncbi:LLM class flavin-dependent oxidoreductase [Nocardioides alcanivorans]|uniref:LLM class flavin-dependent oxidoreductase n=1 Tax=Nocardioides alcanivorans TaxID=2897352 RepID=UPI0024B06A89|nr:LLM class flavin-dependent oxidoreductase [Nocardioides alcanivorans]